MYKKNITMFLIVLSILVVYNSFKSEYNLNIVSFSFSDKTNIALDVLEDYYGSNTEKKELARKHIIKTCLNNSDYNHWEEYIDYIDINIHISNITPNNSESLIVSINLSKDLSLICIMNKNIDEYVFYKSIKNLFPINDIRFIQVPNKNYNFLIIYQTLDERLGAYSYEEFFDIYIFKNNDFEKLLKENIFSEEIYRKKWINKDSPSDQWEKVIIRNEVDFITKDTLKIFVSGINNKYIGYSEIKIPDKNMFSLSSSDNYSYTYYWNPEFENFSLFNKQLNIFNTIGIVIKDSRYMFQYVDSIEKYKILTKSGNVIYLDKKIIQKD